MSSDDGGRDGRDARAAEAEAIATGDQSIAIHNSSDTDENTPSSDFDVDTELTAHKWGRFFPFDEPYPQQVDGIQTATEILANDGYLLAEGACGTGKTMIGLTSGLHAVFDPHYINSQTGDLPVYSTVFAVTSVKQQLKQFVADLRTINANYDNTPTMDNPVGGVVLRGKSDLVPYARENCGPYGDNDTGDTADSTNESLDDGSKSTHEASEDIRENTANIIKRGSNFPLDWSRTTIDPPAESRSDGPTPDDEDGDAWYDEHRAEAVVQIAANINGERLETAGSVAPYPEETPTARDFVRDRSGINGQPVPTDYQGYVDPFYAKYFAADELPIQFRDGDNYVLDGEALITTGVEQGVCPHACLSDLLEQATVVIGNYYHLFDEDTRMLAEEIIGDDTLAVVDEAHMLEERLRDSLSDSLSIYDVRRAVNDLGKVIEILEGDLNANVYDNVADDEFVDRALSSIREEHATRYQQIQEGDDTFDVDTVKRAQRFLSWLEAQIKSEAMDYFDETYSAYNGRPTDALDDNAIEEYDPEIPLQKPDEVDTDNIVEAFHETNQFDDDIWRTLGALGEELETYMSEDELLDRTPTIGDVGEFVSRWRHESDIEYFRELQLEYSPKKAPMPGFNGAPWTKVFNANLYLYNCIPSDKLAEYFDELGGGILMSATLQPFDLFEAASGLSAVKDGEIPIGNKTKNTEGRPVDTVQYGLMFDESNRASHVVTAEPFTYDNRTADNHYGPPTHDRDTMTSTRETYRDAIIDIGASHGNTLLCLPSYTEAVWAGEELRNAPGITKDVLVDESSSAEETTAMLNDFFESDNHQILVTSTLGTVTEGIDYDGEKLHCCAVIGVPYPRMDKKRQAIEAAYDDRFNKDGFDAGVKAPTIRKARQAIGRVIRGSDEEGVRLLVDSRYNAGGWSVNDYLSEQEQHEFTPVSPRDLGETLTKFWNNQK
ncbi:ATP-dependent DNA helicase [Salinibaculum rarum]|uniref:ATP-dependent DNA helicase n=1 Tax=Salinibaculum rarum TaxID=3058903 RepID=UPI0026601985|nr:helicase C-terminal domain-containing protein [Salinibaculum sp. KK48]